MTAKEGLIYHYCPSKTFLSIIENNELWLSESLKTNDLKECSDFLESVDTFLEDRGVDSSWIDNSTCAGIDNLKGILKNVWICCFSEDRDSLSQWRGYADDGKGFSIGFDKNTLRTLRGRKKLFQMGKIVFYTPLSLNKVHYDPSKKQSDIEECFECFISNYPKDEREHGIPIPMFKFNMTLIAPFYKNKSFKEEKELRLIFNMRDEELSKIKDEPVGKFFPSDEIHFRQSPRGIVHYLKMRIPENAIRRITIGPKNLSDKEDIELLLKNHGFNNVSVVKTQIPYC